MSILLMPSISKGQNGIHEDILKLDNKTIQRTHERIIGFEIEKHLLRKIKHKKRKYTNYFFEQLKDTTKAIAAHLVLIRLYGDTLSISEKVILSKNREPLGLEYNMNGLLFRQNMQRQYFIDLKSLIKTRELWRQVLKIKKIIN